MSDENKSKAQLIEELAALRQELAKYENAKFLKQSAQEFMSEFHLLRTLMNNMPDFIFIKDNHRHFTMVNPAYARMMNQDSADGVVGKTDFDFFPRDLAEQFYIDDQAVLNSGKSIINREEPGFHFGEDRSMWVMTTKVPLKDNDGSVVGLIGIAREITTFTEKREGLKQARDELLIEVQQKVQELQATNRQLQREITERQNLQNELANEHKLLRTLIDYLPDYIFVKDTHSRFVVANEAVSSMMGATNPAEVIGKTDFDYFPEDYAKAYFETEQNVMQSGEGVYEFEEIVINQQTQQPFWNLVTKVPLYDEEGIIRGLIGITRDISFLKAAQQAELELAVNQERIATLQNFLRDFSHDFKTPLSVIYTKLYLIEKTQDTEKRAIHFDGIVQQAQQLQKMLEDFMTMSRLHTVQYLIRHEAKLNMLIRDKAVTWEAKAHSAQLNFHTNISELPTIAINTPILLDALDHLINNAIAYTPALGKIWFTASHVESTIYIEIKDTGVGISPKDLAQIFDPFFRVDAARSKSTGGIGLGLAIVKRTVELHDGEILIESILDQGTTVRIQLPIKFTEANLIG